MKSKQVQTVVVICIFLLILGRLYRSWNEVYVAAALAVLGFSWKWFRNMLYTLWMKLGEAIGYVSGKILLTIVFFLVLFPLSFLAKLRGKLTIRLKPGPGSYFEDFNKTYSKSDLENPW